MAQPAAATAVAINVDRCADHKAAPMEVMVVSPANRVDERGRGFAEVGLDRR
jgi:hypothetical protein